MKIAVIYNRSSQQVINLFGMPNREKYALKSIQRIADALKKGGHQVITLEGDKELIKKLEEFMPRVLQGERPGIAFNLSYGIQGQARYTHVPGILEMLGIPYVGSGPLAHSLALDKVVAKMLFRQHDLPTPDFAVVDSAEFEPLGLEFPLIVKPKNESVSMGMQVVNDEKELRDVVGKLLENYGQSVLVERYIAGREINVGLLGNNPVEVFKPAELVFDASGPQIYTYEDKTRQSGRTINIECPAILDPEVYSRAQILAKKAFNALGCYDCARVDMRLDEEGRLYLLEINSLPSLGEHGSYVAAAGAMGLDFTMLVNRLVEVASARYFGTPEPPDLAKRIENPAESIFQFLTKRRDRLEKRVEHWTKIMSRTSDPMGIRMAADEVRKTMTDLGMQPVQTLTDQHDVWTWESAAGFEGGVLFLCHLDVPVNPVLGAEHFYRNPEWLCGEGVGSSRAPIVMLEYALKALKSVKALHKIKLGVVFYSDEGRNCEESETFIRSATQRAAKVLVLTAGNEGDNLVTSRRGHRVYRILVEGKPVRMGQTNHSVDIMRILFRKLEAASALSAKKERMGVSVVNIKPEAFPRLLPHRVATYLQVSYPDAKKADFLDQSLKEQFNGEGLQWDIALVANRPPMTEKGINRTLLNDLKSTAEQWSIPLHTESSLWPSVAGLVPDTVPVVCGIGPVAKYLFTSRERVSRISLVQRTLLLAQLLFKEKGK